VLVGHFPREGRGAEDNYAVYGNFFYQNRHEALFQGEGNVALYANVFVNEHGDGVRIQPHNDVPRRIVIAFNTVLARDAGIVVTPKEGVPLLQQEVFANAVFAGVPFATDQESRNVEAPLESAPSYLTRPLSPLGELDLHPSGKWAAAASGDTIGGKSLPDWGLDLRGEACSARHRRPRQRDSGASICRWSASLVDRRRAARTQPGDDRVVHNGRWLSTRERRS
jgi:hypothetical protein